MKRDKTKEYGQKVVEFVKEMGLTDKEQQKVIANAYTFLLIKNKKV